MTDTIKHMWDQVEKNIADGTFSSEPTPTANTTHDALRPCPFCGGNGFSMQNHAKTVWQTSCTECHAGTPEKYGTKELAEAAWNARAPAAEPVGRTADLNFSDGAMSPEIKPGTMEDYIIVAESDKGGKHSFAAYYLNAYPLEREECECGVEHDDGCPATGWFYDNSNFEYDNCYFPVRGKVLCWAPVPTAGAILSALTPAEPVGRISDEMLNAHLKATNEWTYPHVPATECGVEIEYGITQEDADGFNAEARESLRKGYEAALALAPQDGWTCAALRQGTAGGNLPADCDWPGCGCDPSANKVLEAIDEAGFEITKKREPMAWDANENRNYVPVEVMATEIYNSFAYDGPGVKPAWTPGGNGTKQDEARREARQRLRDIGHTVTP